MTSLALASPARLFERLSRVFEREVPVQDDDPQDARDFLNEMIDRNPDAFSSEQDIQAMMHCFPGRF